MSRKKEIIIVALIILITFIIAFFWQYNASSVVSDYEEGDSTSGYISVTLKGEVLQEKTFKIPKGYTYGYVMLKAKAYLNEYSYIENDSMEIISEDIIITVLSSDKKSEYIENSIYKININTATQAELITIYGIGEARSAKIIKYRENKKITSWSELKSIIGVSNEILERIKEQAIL